MRKKLFLTIGAIFLWAASFAQITVGFQGGEPGDTWGYTSTGADATALSESSQSPNIVSGSASLVVGGTNGGGSCIDGGSGNGPNTVNTFTFDPLDISSSSNFVRTFSLNWGNRFPVCVGTGWDSQEDLVITVYHDGIAQAPDTLATGNNNAAFSIAANQFTSSIPTCVNSFYFEISVTTNRRDEMLFIDDVMVTTPALNTLPVATITGDQTVCIGSAQTVNVTPSSGVSYTWSGLPSGASFTSPNGLTTSAVMDIDWGSALPGIYTISVLPSTVICGVPSDGTPATLAIELFPLPQLAVANDTTICAGEPVVIFATGASTYTWDNGLGAGSSFTVNPSVNTTYHVVGDDGICQNVDSITITLLPGLTIDLTASLAYICEGGTTLLTANGATTYSWQPSNTLSSPTGATVVATPASTSTYTVTGTTGNCQGTASITVSVSPTPIAAFLVNPDELHLDDPSVSLLNTSQHAVTYLWDFGDNNTSTELSPEHTFAAYPEGSYTVTLIAFNQAGCSDTAKTVIPFTESLIYYVPNAFTPDNNEVNQRFDPVFTEGIDILEYKLEIFNRWGELIFESRDARVGWDGTAFGGTIVSDGMYVWKIGFKLNNSSEKRLLTGHVSLLR